MNKLFTLNDLKPGEQGTVAGLACPGSIRRRLLDLGLVAGATVECVGTSPHKDPKAYLICGAVIAIRSEDSSQIFMKERTTYGPDSSIGRH